MDRQIEWRKYLFSFLITAAIFATALYISDHFSQKRLQEVRAIGDQIAIDIMSSETQFALLETSSCKEIGNTFLSKEISTLGEKLAFTESERGVDDPEVIHLKRYYSLLQIKDYLLVKKVSEKCGLDPVIILYFYSNKGNCNDCTKEGYVLTKLREDYPEIRVYALDYNLDLSALQTLISVNKIKGELPILVINDEVHYGYQDLEALQEELVNELEVIEAARPVATSTEEVEE